MTLCRFATALAAGLLLAACAHTTDKREADDSGSLLADCKFGIRTIPRNSPELRCLERVVSGKPYEFPVPVQYHAAYDMECSVKLGRVFDTSKCPAKSVVVGYSVQVRWNKDEGYSVDLRDPSNNPIEGVVVPHGGADTVEYLEFQHRRPKLNPTTSIDYYIYLADLDPKTAEQQKYYLVEAFDNLNTSTDCEAERPALKMKKKDECAGPVLFLGGDTDGRKGSWKDRNFETETGGGFEPPK